MNNVENIRPKIPVCKHIPLYFCVSCINTSDVDTFKLGRAVLRSMEVRTDAGTTNSMVPDSMVKRFEILVHMKLNIYNLQICTWCL